MSVAPVKRKAEERDITSIRDFGRQTGLHYVTARRWWQDEVSRIDPDILAQLAEFFDCEPGDLLEKVEKGA